MEATNAAITLIAQSLEILRKPEEFTIGKYHELIVLLEQAVDKLSIT